MAAGAVRDTTSRYVTDEATGVRRLVETLAGFVGYEWRRLDEPCGHWRRARDWVRYNFNNGQTLGLPIMLRNAMPALECRVVKRVRHENWNDR